MCGCRVTISLTVYRAPILCRQPSIRVAIHQKNSSRIAVCTANLCIRLALRHAYFKHFLDALVTVRVDLREDYAVVAGIRYRGRRAICLALVVHGVGVVRNFAVAQLAVIRDLTLHGVRNIPGRLVHRGLNNPVVHLKFVEVDDIVSRHRRVALILVVGGNVGAVERRRHKSHFVAVAVESTCLLRRIGRFNVHSSNGKWLVAAYHRIDASHRTDKNAIEIE